MKRLLSVILGGALAATGLVGVTATAASANTTPTCVTYGEYLGIHRGMSQSQVKDKFGIGGYEITRRDSGYYDQTWVDTSYWEGGYDYYGNYDPQYNYVSDGYYDTTWVPGGVDTVRSYAKCRSFDRGRGRVGINFDNCTSSYSGMREYAKTRNNPWYLADLYDIYPQSANARVVRPHKS